MGFFSEIDIEVRGMIDSGATWKQVANSFPMLREDEIDNYFANEHDGDYDFSGSNEVEEDDGQPDEYTEWQDYMGGDDWDHGQYDEAY